MTDRHCLCVAGAAVSANVIFLALTLSLVFNSVTSQACAGVVADDTCFFLNTKLASWTLGQLYCAGLGRNYRAAHVDTVTKQQAIVNYLQKQLPVWSNVYVGAMDPTGSGALLSNFRWICQNSAFNYPVTCGAYKGIINFASTTGHTCMNYQADLLIHPQNCHTDQYMLCSYALMNDRCRNSTACVTQNNNMATTTAAAVASTSTPAKTVTALSMNLATTTAATQMLVTNATMLATTITTTAAAAASPSTPAATVTSPSTTTSSTFPADMNALDASDSTVVQSTTTKSSTPMIEKKEATTDPGPDNTLVKQFAENFDYKATFVATEADKIKIQQSASFIFNNSNANNTTTKSCQINNTTAGWKAAWITLYVVTGVLTVLIALTYGTKLIFNRLNIGLAEKQATHSIALANLLGVTAAASAMVYSLCAADNDQERTFTLAMYSWHVATTVQALSIVVLSIPKRSPLSQTVPSFVLLAFAWILGLSWSAYLSYHHLMERSDNDGMCESVENSVLYVVMYAADFAFGFCVPMYLAVHQVYMSKEQQLTSQQRQTMQLVLTLVGTYVVSHLPKRVVALYLLRRRTNTLVSANLFLTTDVLSLNFGWISLAVLHMGTFVHSVHP